MIGPRFALQESASGGGAKTMKRYLHLAVLPFALLIATTLSAQQFTQPAQTRLTASAASAGKGSDAELLQLLDLADSSKTPTSAAAVAPAEHSIVEGTEFTAPPAFRSTRELEAPLPQFHKKVFVTEVAAYTAANILDGITTVRGVQRGFTEASFPQGASEFLGRRPGATRYALTMGAMQTAVTFASYRLQHSHSRVLRMIGHGIMAEGIVDHTSGFVNNLMLGSHP
jgi:hypothetical protein